jgi:RNA polymerase sigma factor (sigma-70 family)
MNDRHSELHTRPSLLLRIRDAADTTSWTTFIEIYGPVVYRYCRKRGLQDADAADVVQEVMSQVARSIRGFEYQPELGRFRDWLGAVTRSKLARFFRKQGQQVPASGEGDEKGFLDSLSGAASDGEWTEQFNAHVLQVALERIRPRFESISWKAFEGVWLEQRPAREVAEELGQPVEAIYVAKSRVLKLLRQEVSVLAEDFPISVSDSVSVPPGKQP